MVNHTLCIQIKIHMHAKYLNKILHYLVWPTKDKIKVSSNCVLSTFKGHMPFTPGRSMLACSCMPIPFLIIRKEPSLKAPEHVTNYNKERHVNFFNVNFICNINFITDRKIMKSVDLKYFFFFSFSTKRRKKALIYMRKVLILCSKVIFQRENMYQKNFYNIDQRKILKALNCVLGGVVIE